MPTYSYECKTCGYTFDVFQSMKDDPIKVCPECGKEVRRLINGGSGIIFKGSGFYVTDSHRPSTLSSGSPKSSTSSSGSSESGSGGCQNCPAGAAKEKAAG